MRTAALVGLLFLAARAHAETAAYAIAIGNNAAPASGLAALRFADDDAVRYYQFFGRFARESRLLAVLDRDTQRRYPGLAQMALAPTLENLQRIVYEYQQKMEADRARGDEPVLYFAFSGHGVDNERAEPYLALTDGPLTQAVLFGQILAKLPTRYSHLIVDACHAGAVVGVRGLFDSEVEGKTIQATPQELTQVIGPGLGPTVGVLFATTADQEAHEWSRYESGVFSHEVLSGLSGAADVNGDRQIEYTEIQAFVAAANRNISDPKAVPLVVARPPRVNQNAVLVRLDALRGTTLLTGDASGLGPFEIELANGQRYLDAHLDLFVSLALPYGVPGYLKTETEEAELPLNGAAVELRKIRLKRRSATARGSIDFAYRRGLFSAPFSASYYRGYVDSIGALGVRFPSDQQLGSQSAPSLIRKPAAVALWTISAALAAAAITTGVLAVQAKSEFDGTTLQRAAIEADGRYTSYLGAAIATGVLTIATSVAGALVWPKARARISQPGGVGLQGKW